MSYNITCDIMILQFQGLIKWIFEDHVMRSVDLTLKGLLELDTRMENSKLP